MVCSNLLECRDVIGDGWGVRQRPLWILFPVAPLDFWWKQKNNLFKLYEGLPSFSTDVIGNVRIRSKTFKISLKPFGRWFKHFRVSLWSWITPFPQMIVWFSVGSHIQLNHVLILTLSALTYQERILHYYRASFVCGHSLLLFEWLFRKLCQGILPSRLSYTSSYVATLLSSSHDVSRNIVAVNRSRKVISFIYIYPF